MSKTAVRIIVIVTAIVNMQFGILQYFLGTATYYYHYGMMNSTVHLTFILVGLTVAITSIPVVIFGIIRAKHTGQRLDFVFSIITLLLGIILVCCGLACEIFYVSDGDASNLTAEETFVTVLRWVIAVPIMLYLTIQPLLRMILTENRAIQYRTEMHKPWYGAVILLALISNLLIPRLEDPSIPGTLISTLSVMVVIFAIVHLIVGLVGLSKADKSKETKT